MKARVKETGKVFQVMGVVSNTAEGYALDEVDLYCDESDNLVVGVSEDYWEKLKHQYAGMAMQGMLSNAIGFDEVRKQAAESGIDNLITLIAGAAMDYATALVEKLKND